MILRKYDLFFQGIVPLKHLQYFHFCSRYSYYQRRLATIAFGLQSSNAFFVNIEVGVGFLGVNVLGLEVGVYFLFLKTGPGEGLGPGSVGNLLFLILLE